jgi:hypothetical protein
MSDRDFYEPGFNWRHSVNASRIMLAVMHLGIGWMSFYRPQLTSDVPGYAAFHAIAPTMVWGAWALIIGVGLMLLPRAHPLLILWQFGSATYFTLFALLVSDGPYGPTWGTIAYGVPAIWSVILAYLTTDGWLRRTQWPQRFRVWSARHWRCFWSWVTASRRGPDGSAIGTPTAEQSILEAVKVAGGAIAGGALIAFAKGFFTNDGKDSRELRGEYRDEIKRLKEERVEMRAELKELENLREQNQEDMEEMREDIRTFRLAMEDQNREHTQQIAALQVQVKALTDLNLYLITSRAAVRADLNAYQRAHNEPETTWPDDPLPHPAP